MSYKAFDTVAVVTACVKKLASFIGICTFVVGHAASVAFFVPVIQTSCFKFADPKVAFATVTEASFNAVACLGTTAIV